MNIEYQELLNDAIDNLKIVTGSEKISINGDERKIIWINGFKFCYVIKKTLSNANIGATIKELTLLNENEGLPALLIVGKIFPKQIDKLIAAGKNYVDRVGNCDIRYDNLTIKIAGIKNTEKIEIDKTTEPIIKLVLYFLQEAKHVDQPFREIQDKTGVSLSTINKTTNILKAKNFLVTTENGRRIAMRDELIEWWQQQYNEFLKPKLLVKRMAFRTPEARKNWKDILLPYGMYWGGDCGANILDGYLIPGDFEIYSEVVSTQLFKTGAIVPDSNGEIKIYKKFWIGESDKNIAPKLVIYADLLGDGDSRCHEAALRLKENGI
ncbi:MAG: type IV toxin-antitoxin system AbiEi family antitoxin [Bacteroidales bacterium]